MDRLEEISYRDALLNFVRDKLDELEEENAGYLDLDDIAKLFLDAVRFAGEPLEKAVPIMDVRCALEMVRSQRTQNR